MKNIVYTLAFYLILQSCTSSQTTKKLEGKVERDQISVTTKVPGKISRILVNQGQFVHRGDTLFVLEIPEADAKKIQAQGALEAAQAQYDMAIKGATEGQLIQLNAKIDALKEQFDFAQKSLDRMHNLLLDSLISQQKYDEVYAKYQGAKSQYLAAQAEIADVENGVRIEQQKMALGQKERALGAVNEVQAALDERYIIAPADMSIETINLKIGELALAGYSIASGYISESVHFRLTIPESKLPDFKKESIKNLSFPFLDNKQIQAKVESVKTLSNYASISTAYPDFEQQESLFEIFLKPIDTTQTSDLLTKATFIIDENN